MQPQRPKVAPSHPHPMGFNTGCHAVEVLADGQALRGPHVSVHERQAEVEAHTVVFRVLRADDATIPPSKQLIGLAQSPQGPLHARVPMRGPSEWNEFKRDAPDASHPEESLGGVEHHQFGPLDVQMPHLDHLLAGHQSIDPRRGHCRFSRLSALDRLHFVAAW